MPAKNEFLSALLICWTKTLNRKGIASLTVFQVTATQIHQATLVRQREKRLSTFLVRTAGRDARWPQRTNRQIDIGLEPKPLKKCVMHAVARGKKALETAKHECLSAPKIGQEDQIASASDARPLT